jgi:hypothetical protein
MSGNGNRPAGRVGQVAGALMVLAAVASCSSSPSSSSAPSSPSVSSPASSAPASSATSAPATAPSTSQSAAVVGVPACATSGLNVTLGASSGYAGGVYVPIVFTNNSGATCTLYGYPGVSLVGPQPAYTQIGLAAQRSTTVPVKLITLASGASANATVQIVDALNFPTATCSPAQASFLRVYPPNQTAPVYVANTSQTCTAPVQTLYITAVQAGSGSST